jgi:hypothetical protein
MMNQILFFFRNISVGSFLQRIFDSTGMSVKNKRIRFIKLKTSSNINLVLVQNLFRNSLMEPETLVLFVEFPVQVQWIAAKNRLKIS